MTRIAVTLELIVSLDNGFKAPQLLTAVVEIGAIFIWQFAAHIPRNDSFGFNIFSQLNCPR
jgi:hypothetical protein